MYKTNWEEKYNRKAIKEMTPEEVLEMWEWQHNLVEDMLINRDRRRKHRRPFTMTIEDATRALNRWQGKELTA